MLKPILFILALFPISYVVDLFNGSSWLINYTSFIKAWWSVIFTVLICKKVFAKNKDYLYDIMEDLRVNQYLAEYQRYTITPYVPPIMLMYLKNPPAAIRPYDYAYVNDTFYRLVVNTFRDRVYVLQEFESHQPLDRPYYLDVIGGKNIAKCLLYLVAPFAWLFFVYFGLEQSMLTDWPLLSLPFILAGIQRGMYYLEAFIKFNPRKLDRDLLADDCLQQVTWREAFPDKEVGVTFVRAYYLEMERRQRYEMINKCRAVPSEYPEWKNANFAPFPYPSTNIPSWEKEYVPYYEQKSQELMDQQATKTSNVVSFPK